MYRTPWIIVATLFVLGSSAFDAQGQPQGTAETAPPQTPTSEPLNDWKHHGSFFVLTTPEGANLPAGAELKDFPLLVRLNRDWFDFARAQPDGSDLRCTLADGTFLAMQIDHWDAKAGEASLWVRVPLIRGNTHQELRLHWGNGNAPSVSDGNAVFNESNGYISVWHMNEGVQDEVRTIESTQRGMSAVEGVIGFAKHLAGNEGIFGGEDIRNYPSGAEAHSTEVWFRTQRPNSTIIGWGNEGGGRGSKVRMQFRSPPHLHIDSDFSDVKGESSLELGKWTHVMHTYERENGKIYINGQLDGAAQPMLDIKTPARLWIGGWYHQYDFVGEIDEVRISRVARSAEWTQMQYANQKPDQTVVGLLVQPGSELSVAPKSASVAEGKEIEFTANAGGARKLIWTLHQGGKESVVAVDRLKYLFHAGRIAGNVSCSLKLQAIYENGTKSIEVPIRLENSIPEPEFAMVGPSEWDGRTAIEINANISNQAAMEIAKAAEIDYRWSVSGMAVIKESHGEKLLLKRALNSGQLVVTCTISNGGDATSQTHTLTVTEPNTDPWQPRSPSADEKPVDHQFYARDDENVGTLHCNGVLPEPADSVFVKVFADGNVYATEQKKLAPDQRYAFSVKLKPGLTSYSFELGSIHDGVTQTLHQATDLICGDAYFVTGQSNALATDWGPDKYEYSSPWIRSFGNNQADGNVGWANAVAREGGKPEIGCWAMELAKNLVERHQIPVCIINGAVGGTLIEAHQRKENDPTDRSTLYGRSLDRIQRAGLTHGIRGVFWYQGENNQGAQGATGKYGWETYEALFLEMAANWKRDYPNIQHYFVFQIWPDSCSMGGTDASDRLRDIQRRLPQQFSHMTAISTLGIKPEGPCHFPPAGYVSLANQLLPLVEQVFYGKADGKHVTAPDLKRAYVVDKSQNELCLEFDQPMNWSDALASQFYLDGQADQVLLGEAVGNTIKLFLAKPKNATSVSYLQDKQWDSGNLLYGKNGIAALTFFEVPISRSGE